MGAEIFDLGGGVQVKGKPYPRPVGLYIDGVEVGTVLIPPSLNIRTDPEINGHFPEYDIIRKENTSYRWGGGRKFPSPRA